MTLGEELANKHTENGRYAVTREYIALAVNEALERAAQEAEKDWSYGSPLVMGILPRIAAKIRALKGE